MRCSNTRLATKCTERELAVGSEKATISAIVTGGIDKNCSVDMRPAKAQNIGSYCILRVYWTVDARRSGSYGKTASE